MSSLTQLGKQLNSFVTNVERSYHYAIRKMADDIERDSQKIIQDFIKNTPSGIVPGKNNRIWTGAMLDNVQAKKTQLGNSYKIEYGWFGFTNPQMPGDYVRNQELGGGVVATGMHSFTAVRGRVRDILFEYQRGKYFGNV